MAEDIPKWAKQRMVELWDAEPASTHDIRDAFARYIASHEEPPVDPLLIEARGLALAACIEADDRYSEARWKIKIHAGECDGDPKSGVKLALVALKRGMEIAREGGAK